MGREPTEKGYAIPNHPIMNQEASRLVLKPGREKSLRHRHPWVFSGAVESVEGDPASGDTVSVVARDGAFLAKAAYCPESQIRARVWSFDANDEIDAAFLRQRLQASIERRAALRQGSDAMRLVHGESDGLPGPGSDRYAGALAVQILSAGAGRLRSFGAPARAELTAAPALHHL